MLIKHLILNYFLNVKINKFNNLAKDFINFRLLTFYMRNAFSHQYECFFIYIIVILI